MKELLEALRIIENENSIDINDIIEDFKQSHQDSIEYGCIRENCGIPAADFEIFCEKYGVRCERINGFFKVDKLKLSTKDFTSSELKLAKQKGYNIRNNIDMIKFSKEIGVYAELHYIPHYWNTYNDTIIDFTAYTQFVKSKLATDTKPSRYYTEIPV